jgi:hypothetical protein
MSIPEPLNLKGIKRYSLHKRKSKTEIDRVGTPLKKGGSVREFLESLPDFLAARDLKEVATSIVNAREKDKPVVLAMGAHPIKVGLSPIIIDLMERRIITAIASNGAAIVHDFEMALVGRTSEDVEEALKEGMFGMAEETGIYLNRAIIEGSKKGKGLGEAVGEMIETSKEFQYPQYSIFGSAFRLKIPATVHVAIGTDIIHIHPECDGSATGKVTYTDFRVFCSVISRLQEGVFINLGSAVIMPEVFLKAVSVVRNLGHRLDRFTTVTMDFQKHYRPMVNVVHRPTKGGGKGYYLIGHHEILFPLLVATILEYY